MRRLRGTGNPQELLHLRSIFINVRFGGARWGFKTGATTLLTPGTGYFEERCLFQKGFETSGVEG